MSDAEQKFIGPIDIDEADVLFDAPVVDGEIGTSTEHGQEAADIIKRVGGTGEATEVSVFADPV